MHFCNSAIYNFIHDEARISISLFLGFHIELNILGTRDTSCVLHEIQIWNTRSAAAETAQTTWVRVFRFCARYDLMSIVHYIIQFV